MKIDNIENLYNLEDTVGILVDKANFNFLGFKLKAQVNNYDDLPGEGEVGAVYAVGAAAPYTYYTYINNDWLNLGIWPLRGPKGQPGDKGDKGVAGPAGPKGDKGDQGATGPAGSGVGVNYITDLDLAVGEAVVAYDGTDGASISKQGTIKAAGTTYNINVEDELPIIPGDNITIDATADGKHLKISATGGSGSSAMEIITIGSGNSGTVSTATMAKLAQSDVLCIVKSNNELYWRMDDQHTPGAMGYTHLGYENGKFIQKNVTFTITTNAWVKTTKDATTVNGVSGAVNIVGGSNVNVTTVDGTITIAATGGGGGSGSSTDGFNNLKAINLTPTTYQGTDSPAGKFTFKGTGGFTLKDNTTGTIQSTTIQLPVIPGNGITFTKTDDGSCEIAATAATRPTITLNTSEATVFTSHYGRTYYTWPNIDATIIDDIVDGNYDVTIYDQTSGGGYYYCPLTGDDMTWIGQKIPTGDIVPSELVGWTYKARESETAASFWRDEWTKSPSSSGGKLYQHNINAYAGSAIIVYCTLYTTDNTQINSLTPWQTKFGTDRVIGAGYVYNANKYYPLLYMRADSESIKAWYLDPDTQKPVATEAFGTGGAFTDTVKEV